MQETIEGTIEKTTFHNQQNGFSVLRVNSKSQGKICVVGISPAINDGIAIRASGTWIEDPNYGMQLKAESIHIIHPRQKKYREISSIWPSSWHWT